jgi:hypothetical protein
MYAALFVLVLGAISIGAYWRKVGMLNPHEKIIVAIQGEIQPGPIAPENISTIPLYHLHLNLWDTLVTEKQGAGIADTFHVDESGLRLTFNISPRAKFSNGREILASDIKASIERLINREENGHINARSAISRIHAEGLRLEIELNKPTPSFLYLLSTPEFGIVPREALDLNGNIKDLSITSGAYTAGEFNYESQSIELSQNSHFRRFVDGAPGSVSLRFLKPVGKDRVEAVLASRAYDFLEFQNSEADSFLSAIGSSGYEHHVSNPSISVFLIANSARISTEQAKSIAYLFQKNFSYATNRVVERPSKQLFPPKTFGSLAESEIPTLIARPESLPSKITLRVVRKDGAYIDEVMRVFALGGFDVHLADRTEDVPFDFRLTGQGMNTEYPEIELHLQMLSPYASFGVSEELKAELRKAESSADDAGRSAAIKAIGRELLSSGKIIPLTLQGYLHAYKQEHVDASRLATYDGNIPLYEIQVK